MADLGISGSGQEVEARFRELTGATESARAALGDAVLDDCHIEIKKASANTLNQVRAVKFIPLVVFHTPTNAWYVIPAPDVIAALRGKSRGQHTENPFESATLGVSALAQFRVSDESLLAETVRAAIERGRQFPQLKEMMDKILSDSKDLATRSIAEVHQLLDDLAPLEP